jgi:Apea-like HEPN
VTSDDHLISADVLARQSVDLRFPADPWDRVDLDTAFSGQTIANPITWVGIIELGKPGPPTGELLHGADWQISFSEKAWEAPGWTIEGTRQDIVIDPPLAVVSIPTETVIVSEARDRGRPALRTMLGYAHLFTDVLKGASLAWEGPVFKNAAGNLVILGGVKRALVQISDAGLQVIRRRLLPLNVRGLSERHRLALAWYAEAWSASTMQSRFTSLWFAVVVAVDSTYSRSKRDDTRQMDRIDEYLYNLAISNERRATMYEHLKESYRIRNDVVHEGNTSAITPDSLAVLGSAVSDFLMADIGRT